MRQVGANLKQNRQSSIGNVALFQYLRSVKHAPESDVQALGSSGQQIILHSIGAGYYYIVLVHECLLRSATTGIECLPTACATVTRFAFSLNAYIHICLMSFRPVSFKAGRRALIGFLWIYGSAATHRRGSGQNRGNLACSETRQQLHTRLQLLLNLLHSSNRLPRNSLEQHPWTTGVRHTIPTPIPHASSRCFNTFVLILSFDPTPAFSYQSSH